MCNKKMKTEIQRKTYWLVSVLTEKFNFINQECISYTSCLGDLNKTQTILCVHLWALLVPVDHLFLC